MHQLSLASLFAIIFFLSITSAAPAELERRSFKVHQKRYDSATPRSGAAAMERAYRKFGFPVPRALSENSLNRRRLCNGTIGGEKALHKSPTVSTVAASPQEADAEFLSPISIGGQTFNLDFDTGSADTWVFSTRLPPSSTAGQTLFDPTKSSTFKLLEGASFEISYGDQSKAAGIVGTDIVNIGGATVNNQAVELAEEVTDSFVEDANSDGLLGLGFSAINTVKPERQKTFFDNIQSNLAEPVFTVNLRHAEVGAYEFGRVDTSKFQGSLTFTPVDSSRGFWEIQSSSFAIGGGDIQSNNNGSPAIADTGTSLMLVDDEVAEAYWSQVKGARFDQDQQAFIFPCDSDLPDFHVALGTEYMGTIPGELMNFSRAGGSRRDCFGGMQTNRGQPFQIYGAIMFKTQFVVFDGGKKQLGFAPHN